MASANATTTRAPEAAAGSVAWTSSDGVPLADALAEVWAGLTGTGGTAGAGPRRAETVSPLAEVLGRPGYEERLRHVRVLPAREAQEDDWPAWVDAGLREAWRSRGIERPWAHQVAAAEHVRARRHVVLATGTASGKSLAYLMPGLTRVREVRGARGERGAVVLYLAPTKALAHDQVAGVRAAAPDVRVATHDGDSSREERQWTRQHAEYVLTNPDMLHHSLLPAHEHWHDLLRHVDLIVVDECHHYRGLFGAHVALVLRRLLRVCRAHGADPVVVLASATMADPVGTASRLTGEHVEAVTEDASPRGPLTLALWEPPLTELRGERGAPVRRAASSETADLLADLVERDVRTLAFVRSRQGVEQVSRRAQDLVGEVDPALRRRIAGYRGGYLPEERRALEQALRTGAVTGLATTSALELGIDVSGLDAVLLAGFPGTRAAFWQQVGRAGRRGTPATAVLVARDDPLDTYLAHHPEALLDAPLETGVFDPANPHVLAPHLCAAAQEHPLTHDDLALFGEPGRVRGVLDTLVARGLLRRRPHGWFWTADTRASDLADLRGAGGGTVHLLESETGRVVGTVDGGGAHSHAHPGAVYVHQGDTWVVESLDLEEHVATMRRDEPGYTTIARQVSDVRIVAERAHEQWGACRLSVGEVEVTEQVVSFLKRRQPGGDVLGEFPLDLPARTLRTTAVWWTVPDDLLAEAGLDPEVLPGASHAAEHCSIGLLPLLATCDRWDIGGLSTARHPDTGLLTVFVHDGHPGGAGFAKRGYEVARTWLTATRETIAACECPEGCPSCVQSPKCGNQNDPLDKAGAVRLLDVLLGAG